MQLTTPLRQLVNNAERKVTGRLLLSCTNEIGTRILRHHWLRQRANLGSQHSRSAGRRHRMGGES